MVKHNRPLSATRKESNPSVLLLCPPRYRQPLFQWHAPLTEPITDTHTTGVFSLSFYRFSFAPFLLHQPLDNSGSIDQADLYFFLKKEPKRITSPTA